MKSLKKINWKSVSAHLSNNEMRRILGGGGGEGGYGGGGTCGYKVTIKGSFDDPNLPPVTIIDCGVSMADALSWRPYAISENHFWWCCDSCGSSSYCG